MSDRGELLSFGLSEDLVSWALKSTGNRGFQAALDFLVENEDKPVPSGLRAAQEQRPPASAAAGANDEDDDDPGAFGMSDRQHKRRRGEHRR
ncbi:hypothetical protein FRC00_010680, partial [Tulasnella sp. 408]